MSYARVYQAQPTVNVDFNFFVIATFVKVTLDFIAKRPAGKRGNGRAKRDH
jgi:hypothetical protein